MRLTYVTSLVLLGILAGISAQNANAQLGVGKAFTLEGTGYAISDNSILPASVDLQFIISQKGTTTEFTLQSGLLNINGKDLDVSSFTGTLLKNGQYFRIAAKASDSDGKEFSLKALGTLIAKTQTNSIYSLTGTLGDPAGKSTKLIYTTKVSEFTTTKPADSKKKEITIRILKGSANPEEQTYKEQIGGFSFKFFSEDRISIGAGGTITFVNEDVVSHSLKSGTSRTVSGQKAFIADGKVSSGDIQPGKSWSVTFQEPGFYRIFDEKYQWMDTTIFVSKDSSSKTLGSGNPHN
ncbi:MAG: hypothetical protein EPO62_03020 [Candidatus Nitrosotenuis sp.]|nr:MAG: hypothetical protein EPO62_03020 [Candidatus Nitrosotenuis sp.]